MEGRDGEGVDEEVRAGSGGMVGSRATVKEVTAMAQKDTDQNPVASRTMSIDRGTGWCAVQNTIVWRACGM